LISKWLVFRWGCSAVLVPGFLDISCAKNTGAVFGILAGQKWLLLLLSGFAVVIIIGMQFRGMQPSALGGIAMGLLLGGALGNVYDRFALGYVRDFINLHAGKYHWPTFNLADTFLCLGAGLLILRIAKDERRAGAARKMEQADRAPSGDS